MSIVKSGKEPFKAYARLISVLGDQLISDKWVGVIELVKNSYDADADQVYVRFLNFEEEDKQKRAIEIEDNGVGMDLATVLDVWMKPATPNKLNKKKGKHRQTSKGRVMQGDKGVGRFAVYKLGQVVEMYTKTANSNEVKLTLDFEKYADDRFEESDHKDQFLQDIKNEWQEHATPEQITNKSGHGTKIIIRGVKDEWKKRDLNKLLSAFYRMTPPKLPKYAYNYSEFKVDTYWDNELRETKKQEFDEILERAPYLFEGTVSEEGTLEYEYTHNRKTKKDKINFFNDEEGIASHQIWRLKFFKENFLQKIDPEKGDKLDNLVVSHKPSFGSFMFFFYAFDLSDPAEGLLADDKKLIKEHSVFLFRDNVRVFPYGERGVDWLLLNKSRAEDKAGKYFSYNDLLGFVFITQEENPRLRDAADREGLMNIKGSYDDFVSILQACLKVMKDFVTIDKENKKLAKKKAEKTLKSKFENAFKSLQNKVLSINDPDLTTKSNKLFDATNKLVEKTTSDLKITQELAGTGMAVEKATHDTMTLLNQLRVNTKEIVKKLNKQEPFDDEELRTFLTDLDENLQFLYEELQVLQPLTRVARKVTKDVSVKNVAQRISRYFRKELKDNINLQITVPEDIVIRTNTGLILQVLLNLMDNAIYWLDEGRQKEKNIIILIDGVNQRVIFADNGSGIPVEQEDIIFSEFYSKKEEGRGLGLYIVRELLERIGATISVLRNDKEKLLPGANFIINFNQTD